MRAIDISIFPKNIQQEMMDYYYFLLNKYTTTSHKTKIAETAKPFNPLPFRGIMKTDRKILDKQIKELRNEWDR